MTNTDEQLRPNSAGPPKSRATVQSKRNRRYPAAAAGPMTFPYNPEANTTTAEGDRSSSPRLVTGADLPLRAPAQGPSTKRRQYAPQAPRLPNYGIGPFADASTTDRLPRSTADIPQLQSTQLYWKTDPFTGKDKRVVTGPVAGKAVLLCLDTTLRAAVGAYKAGKQINQTGETVMDHLRLSKSEREAKEAERRLIEAQKADTKAATQAYKEKLVKQKQEAELAAYRAREEARLRTLPAPPAGPRLRQAP